MRIISGIYRGMRLQAPKGDKTRPTTDRVKESCMSALENALGGFENERVLDAFAGSGALGLETLSRGAAFCQFCEKDVSVLKVLKQNIESLRIASSDFQISKGDVLKQLFSNKAFSVVLLDPPYKTDSVAINAFIENLHRTGGLANNALVLYEHATSANLQWPGISDTVQYETVFQKKYGDTTIDIVRVTSKDQ